MKRIAALTTLLTFAALLLLGVSTVSADKKIKAHKSQTGHTFTNDEVAAAHGLHVVLSAGAEVVMDDATGQADECCR